MDGVAGEQVQCSYILGQPVIRRGFTCLPGSFQSSLKVPVGGSLLLDGALGSVEARAHLVPLARARLPASATPLSAAASQESS